MKIISLTLLFLAVNWDWSEAASVADSKGALSKDDTAFWSRLLQMSLMPTPPTTPPPVQVSDPTSPSVLPPTPPPVPPSTLPPVATTSPTSPPVLPPTPPPVPQTPGGLCFQTNEELRAGVDQFFSGNETSIEIQYGRIEDWCFTSNVTDMSNLFLGQTSFNRDISSWNVQYITDMSTMFREASAFNQPLARWNTSSVTNMSAMFYAFPGGSIYNQPLGAWDVSKVTNMNRMFFFNAVFNQPLESWDVSSVTNMDNMFAFALSFNQPLRSWNVSSVIDMGGMFYSLENTMAFNQDLCAWGPLLQGRSVVLIDPNFGRNMFTNTGCPSQANPNLAASPPGPFCYVCQ